MLYQNAFSPSNLCDINTILTVSCNTNMKNRITYDIAIFILLLLTVVPGMATDTACRVSITSYPEGGLVYIDGIMTGTTPLAINLSCREHTLAIEKSGYQTYKKIINPSSDPGNTINANLEYNSGRGSIIIESDPPGATVYLDGAWQGITPARADNLIPGRHLLLLKKDGCQDLTDSVPAVTGTVLTYKEYLIPKPQSGYLSVTSYPSGALVSVDGNDAGTTPTLPMQVPAGNHSLTLRMDGYRDYRYNISVNGGESTPFHADLIRIPDSGILIIDSVPPGAMVIINRTPKALTPAVLEGIPDGVYFLELWRRDYQTLNTTIAITGGETQEIVAYLSNRSAEPGFTDTTTYYAFPNASVPPEGIPDTIPSIDRSYTWYSNGHEATIKLQIPQELYKYYQGLNHRPASPEDYRRYMINERDRGFLRELTGLLKDAGGTRQLTSRRDYHNAVAFVQSITYELDSDYNGNEEYWKYPIETLADGRGDCEDTAILTAAILKEMDYDVALVLLPDHAAVAVACDTCNGYYYPLNGKQYYYLETTGAGYSLGMIGDEYKTAAAEVIPI